MAGVSTQGRVYHHAQKSERKHTSGAAIGTATAGLNNIYVFV